MNKICSVGACCCGHCPGRLRRWRRVAGDGAAVVPSSGFLSDYSKLRPVDGVDGTYRYIGRPPTCAPPR